MASSKVSTSLLGAVAGSAMLLSIATPSSAFTLAAPALAQTIASPDIQHVWWDRWGRWHPNHRHWGWYRQGWTAPPAYGFYPTPAPPAFGIYVSPPPVVYEYYGPRQRWGDEGD